MYEAGNSRVKAKETLDESRVSFYNKPLYAKTMTKTVGYILKLQRVGDGVSLTRVEYI